MGKTFREGHEFPPDFGFTGSAGKATVRQHLRSPKLSGSGLPQPGPGRRSEAKLGPPPAIGRKS